MYCTSYTTFEVMRTYGAIYTLVHLCAVFVNLHEYTKPTETFIHTWRMDRTCTHTQKTHTCIVYLPHIQYIIINTKPFCACCGRRCAQVINGFYVVIVVVACLLCSSSLPCLLYTFVCACSGGSAKIDAYTHACTVLSVQFSGSS